MRLTVNWISTAGSDSGSTFFQNRMRDHSSVLNFPCVYRPENWISIIMN
jgi:hypothetical protein